MNIVYPLLLDPSPKSKHDPITVHPGKPLILLSLLTEQGGGMWWPQSRHFGKSSSNTWLPTLYTDRASFPLVFSSIYTQAPPQDPEAELHLTKRSGYSGEGPMTSPTLSFSEGMSTVSKLSCDRWWFYLQTDTAGLIKMAVLFGRWRNGLKQPFHSTYDCVGGVLQWGLSRQTFGSV
jgi:hypothetical protein